MRDPRILAANEETNIEQREHLRCLTTAVREKPFITVDILHQNQSHPCLGRDRKIARSLTVSRRNDDDFALFKHLLGADDGIESMSPRNRNESVGRHSHSGGEKPTTLS